MFMIMRRFHGDFVVFGFLFFFLFSFFFFPLKRKRNGLVCLSVLAWLLCPCGLSVWLCSLVFLCLAVFRCFCSVCVWAAGCVAARLVAAVQLFGVPAVFPSSFVLSSWTLVVGLTSGFPWFMSCHVELPMHTQPLFSWAGCVCGPSQKK